MQKPRILVVDDEDAIRSSLRSLLEADGYDVDEAPDGADALALLQAKPFELVISDQNMPGMSGIDLLKLVRVRHPSVVRIMLTGDTDPETTIRSINESEVYRFIRKPWHNRDLRTIVYFALEVGRLQKENAQLIELGRRQREIRKAMESDNDPADIESQLQLLAEEEIRLLGGDE
ncbi:MAG TPA: response regulator [Myxococcales bacterium]|nr:response regulator [Myxococcales bacterium]